MSVPVYLAELTVKKPLDHRPAKIKRLCDAVGLAEKVKPLGKGGEDEVVAIKLHFGETGNDTYLHPTFAVAGCGLCEGGGWPSLPRGHVHALQVHPTQRRGSSGNSLPSRLHALRRGRAGDYRRRRDEQVL